MPLNMAPPLRLSCPAVLGPNHSSIVHPLLNSEGPTRWSNSSLKEREYGLLRRANERGYTDSYIRDPFGTINSPTGMASTGAERETQPALVACSAILNGSLVAPLLVQFSGSNAARNARFSRARIRHFAIEQAVGFPLSARSSTNQPDDPLVHALLYSMWLVAVWCACAVILDFAMAVLGVLLRIAMAPPMIYIHAITCTMNMCMRIMSMPYVIPLTVSMHLITLIPMSEAAGLDQPKTNTLEYFLPGVTRWDGLPFHDFRRIWWIALCAALGSVSQDSYSLLQTARGEDPATTAAFRTQSENRNQRLFGAILNYIEATSWVYRFASAHFNNNGRGLFDYLYVYGHLPYTPEQQQSLETEWTDATMSKVGIKFDENAVFKWAEYVISLAEKLNKNEREKRVKYLSGFPTSFDVVVVPERQLGAVGTYTHPALYPAHDPRLAPAVAAHATAAAAHAAATAAATAAGTAAPPPLPPAGTHPLAGEPDIQAMALGFYPEWARMCEKGMIKSAPRGMAYHTKEDRAEYVARMTKWNEKFARQYGANAVNDSLSDENENYEEHAFLARDRVTRQTVCLACGGIGHAANVDGLGECLTARLGHRVPHSDLNRMTYPDGYTPPQRYSNRPSNSNSHTRNTDQRRRYNSNPRSHARIIEPDPLESFDDDMLGSMSPQDIEEMAMRLNAESTRRNTSRNGDRSRDHARLPRRPNDDRRFPASRRPRFPPRHGKARVTDEIDENPLEETLQSSAPPDADDDYDDPAEHHARLAVALGDVVIHG